ncbi:MAG: tripartite tricarboxylate transporter permease [Firmicutes bacterium]|nr:tripartite tricarboxylate transporter permease [Bacillota bacterium]
MLVNILSALTNVFTPFGLLISLLGATYGMILGAIPGLNATTALILILPVTYAMKTIHAYILLMAVWIGGISGGYIGSILVGIPGTIGSVATVYDGYEMTKKGESGRALSAAAVANFLGTVPSLIIAMFACKIISQFAVGLGAWEYFSLCMCAMVLVVTLSKGNFFKGMISTGLGLLLAEVGFAPVCATPRFTFGHYELAGGFTLVCVMMGLFAGRVIILEYAREERTGEAKKIKVTGFDNPLKDYKSNIKNTLRSFFIGLWIGFLPGMGSALSNVVAYAQEQSASKHPEEFGHGCVDGVIAPEVANNASVGGALIPAISLGIPGDGATALLLGALILHGIDAGPLLMAKEPELVYTIFVCGILAGIFVLAVQILGIKGLPMLLNIPYHWLYPAIVIFCFIGSYVSSANTFTLFATLGLTLLGLWMSYAGIPASPFCLAFVLGYMVETNFRRAMSYRNATILTFFTRPVSCILLIVAFASLAWPYIREHFFAGKNLAAEDED